MTRCSNADAALAVHTSRVMSLVMGKAPIFAPEHTSAIIEMALSDHVSFSDIQSEYGISEKQVKTLMRENLKPSSYKTWRKRVRDFSDRRAHYK